MPLVCIILNSLTLGVGTHMLGKYVLVRVTKPMNSFDVDLGITSQLNFGKVESGIDFRTPVVGAYIMGVSHPVRMFEGRVIAVVRRKNGKTILVVAPKSKRYIVHDIEDAISYAEIPGQYTLNCLYEYSCGAIIYRIIRGQLRFLVIQNKKSCNWGFPKGHMERGEDEYETAYREVLEETGIHVKFLPDFKYRSEYSIQNKIEKRVVIFLGTTEDTHTTIQKEEIEEYLWLDYEKALKTLKFPNDRQMLTKAKEYLLKAGIMNESNS